MTWVHQHIMRRGPHETQGCTGSPVTGLWGVDSLGKGRHVHTHTCL